MSAEPDWSQSEEGERKALYQAVKRVMREAGLSLEAVIEQAEGRPVRLGVGYEDNCRAGKMGRRRAHLLYEWLVRHHPAKADALDTKIGASYASAFPSSLWEKALAAHGVFGQLRLVEVMMQQQRQVQVAQGKPEPVQATIRLMQPFWLALDGEHRGYALGFQWIAGRWMPLPLAGDSLGIRLDGRAPYMPQGGPNGSEPYYIEYSELGLRRMAVVVVPEEVGARFEATVAPDKLTPPSVLDRLAEEMMALPPQSWSLYRLNGVMLATSSSSQPL